MCVRSSQHVVQLLLGGETLFNFGSEDRPIAMITREFGIGLSRIVFVAVGKDIHAPCIPWVLSNRRDPNSGDTQFLEETVIDLFGDTSNITTLIINDV